MDHHKKIKVLRQLARTDGEITEKALEKEAAKIAAELESETRYDLLKQQIELLDIFAFRLAETTVGAIRRFLERLSDLDLTHNPEFNLNEDELTGYENKNHLIVEVLKLLDRIRYHKLEDILEIFVSHTQHDDAMVRKQAEHGLKHLAEYNIDIYYSGENRAGFGARPQLKILKWLEQLSDDERLANFAAITILCDCLLSPSMEGTSWDYQSVTLTTTSIRPDDDIKSIRQRSIGLLEEIYTLAVNTSDKTAALNAMLSATRTSNTANGGDDVLNMVSEDTLEILAFFKKILAEENLQIVQKLEHDAFWRFRHAPSDEVKASALEVRDLLADHDEYIIYKDLIGFEGVFEVWEASLTKEPDFGAIEEYRSTKAKEYADSINTENWTEWQDRIIGYATTESDDLATFPKFHEFLQQFAKKSPDLALKLLTENLDEVRAFSVPLLRGIWAGPRKSDLRALMLEWVAAGQQLIAITKLFLSNDDIDEALLEALLNKAIEDADRDILVNIVAVVASNYADGREDLVPKFFLPAIKSFAAMKDASWIHELWYRRERKDILHSLGEEGREIVLNGLLVASEIDYHAEELLIPLAKDNPDQIIAFFGERLRYKNRIKSEDRYEAIPFQFHGLHEILADFPELAVDIVRSWFKGNGALFQYYGANLLKIIFPDFTAPFGAKLLELVQTGERQNIEFVLSVMRNYEGEIFLHGICREIIVILPANDEFLDIVEIVLRSTGVVSGEFGFSEAYERKIKEITPWLSDENEAVRQFAVSYIGGLEQWAESERRRVQEEIELRKHAYGVREKEPDGDSEQ